MFNFSFLAKKNSFLIRGSAKTIQCPCENHPSFWHDAIILEFVAGVQVNFDRFGLESAKIRRFGQMLARHVEKTLDLEVGAGENGFRESNMFVKEIDMTNRQRTEVKIVHDGRATGACPSRPVLRNRRRASGRADIIEERKT